MNNIINDIVNIDTLAQKKLAEANRIKEEYQAELAQRIEQKNLELVQEGQRRIEIITKTEEELVAQEKEQMEKARQKSLEKLQSVYDKNHSQLEDDIFKTVVDSLL